MQITESKNESLSVLLSVKNFCSQIYINLVWSTNVFIFFDYNFLWNSCFSKMVIYGPHVFSMTVFYETHAYCQFYRVFHGYMFFLRQGIPFFQTSCSQSFAEWLISFLTDTLTFLYMFAFFSTILKIL